MNQKVSIIGSAGIPAEYGGFETLVEQLVKNVPHKYINFDLVVYCSGKKKLNNFHGASLKYVGLNANGISSILYDGISIIRAGLDKSNCLLVLGCSGAIFIPIYKIFFKGKVITNVDGIEWRREKWSWLPSKFLKLSEIIAVRYSDKIISDNKAVAEYIFEEYGSNSSVIPYGGDHINFRKKPDKPTIPFKNISSYFLSICRIEPENNINMILEAFRITPKKNIIFIGNWNNSKYGKDLKDRFSLYSNIHILDPIYDQDKLNLYRFASFGYIHGHSAGGTNPSLVEAMYFSNYILCYDCNFNRYTTDNKALYFKDKSSLAEIISNSNAMPVDQTSLHKIALERYNWESVSNAYFKLIKS
jgi:glycosyltransferase involved in cell wall biosynthesis